MGMGIAQVQNGILTPLEWYIIKLPVQVIDSFLLLKDVFFVCAQSWPLLNGNQVFYECLLWRFLIVIPGTSFAWPDVFLLESVPTYPCASSSENQPTPLLNLVHCHLPSWSWFFQNIRSMVRQNFPSVCFACT